MNINYWTANKYLESVSTNWAAALLEREAAEDILNRFTAWSEGISSQEYETNAEVIEASYEALCVKADKAREQAEALEAVAAAAHDLATALLNLTELEEYWEGRA